MINSPFGFRPFRHVTALGHSFNKYKIASGTAVDLAIDDMVKSDGAGGITRALPGDACLGLFKGWNMDGPANSLTDLVPFKKVWVSGTVIPGNNRAWALVHDDPGETFEVQTSDTITEAHIGKLVDLVYAAYDPVFGQSRMTIGAPGGAASQFRIERILEKSQRIADANNNSQGYSLTGPGQYALVEVKYAKHERGGVTAIAV